MPPQIKSRIEVELFSLPKAHVLPVYMHALMLCCFDSLVSTQTFWRVLTAFRHSCVKIKNVLTFFIFVQLNIQIQWYNNSGSLEEGVRKRC